MVVAIKGSDDDILYWQMLGIDIFSNGMTGVGEIRAFTNDLAGEAGGVLDENKILKYTLIFAFKSVGYLLHIFPAALFVGESENNVIIWKRSVLNGFDGRVYDFEAFIVSGHDYYMVYFGRVGIFFAHDGHELEVFDMLVEMVALAIIVNQAFVGLVRVGEILHAPTPIYSLGTFDDFVPLYCTIRYADSFDQSGGNNDK